MLQKSLTLQGQDEPDVFVYDLEDSVPLVKSDKDAARTLVRDFIRDRWQSHSDQRATVPLLAPRVNTSNDLLADDIAAICSHGAVDAIVTGKANTPDDIIKVCELIELEERKNSLEVGSIKLIPTIESALGIIKAFEICSCAPSRVVAVAFGADDYAEDLGFTRDTSNPVEQELFFARSELAVAATAAGILSLDTPNVNFKNEEGLVAECKAVRSMGFKGKFAIHPSQVKKLNHIFGISDDEAAYAQRVVDQFEQSVEESRRGSISVEGRMVDVPVYKRLKRVLEMYHLQRNIPKRE